MSFQAGAVECCPLQLANVNILLAEILACYILFMFYCDAGRALPHRGRLGSHHLPDTCLWYPVCTHWLHSWILQYPQALSVHTETQRSRRGRGSLYTSLTWRHSFWNSCLTTCISTDSLGMNVFLVFFFLLPSSELSCSALRSKLSLHRFDEILPVLSNACEMTGTITNTVWKPRSARECWLWKQRCQASYGVLRARNDSVNVKTNSQHSANQAWP